MSRRVLLIALAVLVVAAAVAAVLAFRRTRPGGSSSSANETVNVSAVSNSNTTSAAAAAQADRQAALAIARLAVERAGSYAAATAGTAADELAPLATEAGLRQARDRARTEAIRLTALGPGATVTTKALAAALTRFDPRSATVRVEAQREESVIGRDLATSTLTVAVALLHEGDAWKADRLTWP